MKNSTKKLPHIEVSRKEFIRLFVENGGDPEKASMHAQVTEGLRSYAHIGNQMVRSKGEESSK